jgi:hypothetical protein
MIASLLIHLMIVGEVNYKRDARSQLSYLDRNFLGILDAHRQLYPKSILRIAMVLALGLSVALVLGFTFIQSLQKYIP